jgi:putative membrane protein
MPEPRLRNTASEQMLDEEKRGAGSERVEENEFRQELKLADKLALERTVLAADRTMLAGVRTSMAFIGFGFTIFNILKYVQEHSPIKVIMRPQTPRNIGAFLLLAGVLPLCVMIINYSRTLKRMGRKESVFSNPNFQMAVAILLLGTILLLALIGHILLL